MLPFIAAQQTKVVVCVSCCRSRDGTHEHVTALTVRSATGREQRITRAEAAAQLRHPRGEHYAARSPVAGKHADLVAAPCPHCHEDAHLRLSGGGRIEDLPRCR
jgi:hypothetical protein